MPTSRSMKEWDFVINPKKCTECIGHFDKPQCAEVCPVDNTCIIDRVLSALPSCSVRRPMSFENHCRGGKVHSADVARRWRPGSGFRLAVAPGGCSGLVIRHQRAAEPASAKSITQYKDIKLFMTAESRILLHGVTIDFVDSPSQTGLVFRQPPGTNTCSKN